MRNKRNLNFPRHPFSYLNWLKVPVVSMPGTRTCYAVSLTMTFVCLVFIKARHKFVFSGVTREMNYDVSPGRRSNKRRVNSRVSVMMQSVHIVGEE